MNSNSTNKTKILVIAGATASGKSSLALNAASQLNGEIISIDSMQVYRGIEIGTAQPTWEERSLVPHHLVGIKDFMQRVDVTEFVKLAEEKIQEVSSRGALPILAGGTGHYLKTILRGIDDVPASREIRSQLDAEYDFPEKEDILREKLKALDPAGFEVYSNSRRRMIRALEVFLVSGKSILSFQSNMDRPLKYDCEMIVISHDPEILRERITQRAKIMLETGWIEEAKAALENGLLNSPTAHQAIGYRQIGDYLAGKLNKDELLSKIISSTCQYARRQRTWFRHQHPEAKQVTLAEAKELLKIK